MTRKHFNDLADAIAKCNLPKDGTRMKVVNKIGDVCRKYNRDFSKFLFAKRVVARQEELYSDE